MTGRYYEGILKFLPKINNEKKNLKLGVNQCHLYIVKIIKRGFAGTPQCPK